MSEVSNAIRQIASEKGLTYEAVLTTIEAALAAAYRKDFGSKTQNIKVNYDPETGGLKVYDEKVVVEDMPEEEEESESESEFGIGDSESGKTKSGERETGSAREKGKLESGKLGVGSREKGETRDRLDGDYGNKETGEQIEDGEEERRFNPKTEMQISDARLIKVDAEIGDEIKMELEVPGEFGRMAAQTAKQVIIQKLREAERDMVFNEFKDKEGEVISGMVQRREGKVVLVDLGKTIGVLPAEEQIMTERYNPGSRIKVYVKSVGQSPKGPEIILSRTSEEILKKVFYLEIPEISNGLIEIKSIAREAGSRSKIAVATEFDNVDPIGSCVGQRGARIQTIIGELGGEKVDIIEYDNSISKFITNALSPAKILEINLDEKEHRALVRVAEDQFSLAIGKSGQNVRLAARLTGWKIDIAGAGREKEEEEARDQVIGDQEESDLESGTGDSGIGEQENGDQAIGEIDRAVESEEAKDPVKEEKPKKTRKKKEEGASESGEKKEKKKTAKKKK